MPGVALAAEDRLAFGQWKRFSLTLELRPVRLRYDGYDSCYLPKIHHERT